jgi:putative ABC transport system permease protein
MLGVWSSQEPGAWDSEIMIPDLRYAVRVLLKTPGFTLFALFTIALGIGANSAIFSVVNGVLLKPLQYREANRLVWVWSTRKDVSRAFFSIPNFLDTREQTQTIDQLFGLATWGVNFAGTGETERLQGMRMSGDAFGTLGVQPQLGRMLQPADEADGAAHVVMLSYGMWHRRFGADPAVVGRTLTLNDIAYTIVGVLPSNFIVPNFAPEIVAPLQLNSDPRRTERGGNFLRVIALLKPGITVEQARLDLAGITERLSHDFPEDNGNLTPPRVIPLQEELTGSYRQSLAVLLGAVVTVLLIACANLANLQLARAAARQRENAIRSALGASRWQLLRQNMAEGLVLSAIGGVLGLLIAIWAKDFLLHFAPGDFPRIANVTIDLRVLLFCSAISLMCGVLLGLAPGLHTLRSDPNNELKDAAWGGSAGAVRSRGRNALIVAEIALSLVLLVAAGLVIKSFAQLRNVDPGFGVDRSMVVRLSLPAAKYSTGEAVKKVFDKVATKLGVIPGIESVAATSALPMSGVTARTEFLISGHSPAKPSDVPAAHHQWVSKDYFEALRIPLRRGRNFLDQDNERSAGVVIVDEALARRFFGEQNPIGAHIFVTMGDNLPSREYEIVGIAGNVKRVDLTENPLPTFYGPIAQAPKSAVPLLASNFTVVLHTRIEPDSLAAAIRSKLRQIDSGIAVSSVKPLDQFLADSVAARKFSLILLAVFAGTALVLAATGLYAVIAYLVSQRTREIGVRLALGAQRSDVLSLIIGRTMRLVCAGLLIGVAGAFLTSRTLSALLFQTSPTDPAIYGAVALLLGLVAIIASYLPARQAMKVDPIIALRAE